MKKVREVQVRCPKMLWEFVVEPALKVQILFISLPLHQKFSKRLKILMQHLS
jgi:hypothetical protein